jgi:hypothetical protein
MDVISRGVTTQNEGQQAALASEAMDPILMNDLLRLARKMSQDRSSPGHILSSRSDLLVIRVGSTVVKAHAPGTSASELRARLSLLLSESLSEIFLAPLHAEIWTVSDQRFASLWPVGIPVDEQLATAPWQQAAGLLARLHQVPLPKLQDLEVPGCRASIKVQAVISQLKQEHVRSPDAFTTAILAAAETLRPVDDPADSMRTLVHGDWHFGQLLALNPSGKRMWRLIDPDDMGVGDPAWDLARPAAFFAAGLIPPDVWLSFLKTYRASGGSGFLDIHEPWPRLESPARAVLIQCAASAVLRSRRLQRPLAAAEYALIAACRRMARVA